MKARISLITLGVENLERAVAFYRDGLGLQRRALSAGNTNTARWRSLTWREAPNSHCGPRGSRVGHGLPVGDAESDRFHAGAECHVAGAGGRGDGAGHRGRGDGAQDGRRDVLRRLCRVFPGSGRACLGDRLESGHAAARLGGSAAGPGWAGLQVRLRFARMTVLTLRRRIT